MATPVPVHERLRAAPLTESVRDGNRVRVPMRSAMYWSSEMVLRNELLAGCGAAVRKLMSEGCPPSTFGCDTPLITVKSLRCASSSLRYGEATYSRPAPVGKNRSGRTPRLLQMPNIRRGLALGASEEDAARTNRDCIASSNGSDIATPTPRRKRRRDRA